MAKKNRKRRPAYQYQLPPKAEHARQAAARLAELEPRPMLPQRRMILGAFGMFLLCVGMVLGLWLPAHSLVQDLRSRGVTVAATVTGVDNKPKFVKVRLVQGPKRGTEVELWDYSGMYPDVHVGESLAVTYDPKDPHRSLTRDWVTNPPVNLPVYGASALAFLVLAGVVAVTLRRCWILRTWPPQPSDPTQPEQTGSKKVRLTKP